MFDITSRRADPLDEDSQSSQLDAASVIPVAVERPHSRDSVARYTTWIIQETSLGNSMRDAC